MHMYRYLVAKSGRLNGEVALANHDLAYFQRGGIAVRDEAHNCYRVFPTRDSMWEQYGGVPEDSRHWHEVVFGGLPQRLKFDLDITAAQIDAIQLGEALGGEADQGLRQPGPEDVEGEGLLGGFSASEEQMEGIARFAATLGFGGRVASGDASRRAKVDAVVELFLEVVLDALYERYSPHGVAPTRESLIVTTSSGDTPHGYKYSFHVLVAPYAVRDNTEAKEFTDDVVARLPAAVRPLVDQRVNSQIQHFRLTGSSKRGSPRVKRVTSDYYTRDAPLGDTLVAGAPGCRVLPRVYAEPGMGPSPGMGGRPRVGIDGPSLEAVLRVARESGALDGHTFRDANWPYLHFDRLRPTLCALCRRTHDHENSLILLVEPGAGSDSAVSGPGVSGSSASGEIYWVLELCRRRASRPGEPPAVRRLGRVALRAPAASGPGLLRPRGRKKGAAGDADGGAVACRIRALQAGDVDPHAANSTRFEKVPDARRNVYDAPRMRPYEDAATLVVKSQMGLGKSRALKLYVDANFARQGGGLYEPRVLMVTFRRTFSQSARRELFNDFALYSDSSGPLDPAKVPRLIVQAESLWRVVPGQEPYDLVILDETESILDQFNSGLHRHLSASFALFQWALRTARTVVCLDANAGDRTFRILARIRPDHPPFFHWNQYQKAAADTFHFTTDISAWLARLVSAVGRGEKIVVPTNSLTEASAIVELLGKRCRDKIVGFYSSQTPPSLKNLHFGDVGRYWSEFDVLVYTPTVSAGISYEEARFDTMFGYFTDASCDVETCRQMLGRVRSLSSKEYFICLSGVPKNMPTEVVDLRALVYSNRAGLCREIQDPGVNFAYGDGGEVRCYESDYFYLWLETTRMKNLSLNSFVARFIDQVADTGARIGAMAALSDHVECGADDVMGLAYVEDIRDARSAVRESIRSAETRRVAEARDIAPVEASDIRERLRRQDDVPPGDKSAYDKFRLRRSYDWFGRPVDAAFVGRYWRRDIRVLFRNLTRIMRSDSLVGGLRLIQAEDSAVHRQALGLGPGGHAPEAPPGPRERQDAEERDIHRPYTFHMHHLAVWCLCLCGFRCIDDSRRVRLEDLASRVRGNEEGLVSRHALAAFEFRIIMPSRQALALAWVSGPAAYAALCIRPVNSILRQMYGIEVRRARLGEGGNFYRLCPQNIRYFDIRRMPPTSSSEVLEMPIVVSYFIPVVDGEGPGADDIIAFLMDRAYDAPIVLDAADSLGDRDGPDGERGRDAAPVVAFPTDVPGPAEYVDIPFFPSGST